MHATRLAGLLSCLQFGLAAAALAGPMQSPALKAPSRHQLWIVLRGLSPGLAMARA